MEDWKVQLTEEPGRIGYQIYIHRTPSAGVREFITKGGYEHQVISKGERTERDLTFGFIEHDQLRALVEAFSSKGFKTDNDHKVEGLLEATKYHLEDMRTLALKKGKK